MGRQFNDSCGGTGRRRARCCRSASRAARAAAAGAHRRGGCVRAGRGARAATEHAGHCPGCRQGLDPCRMILWPLLCPPAQARALAHGCLTTPLKSGWPGGAGGASGLCSGGGRSGAGCGGSSGRRCAGFQLRRPWQRPRRRSWRCQPGCECHRRRAVPSSYGKLSRKCGKGRVASSGCGTSIT